jgi:RHS repeat-associated protein
MDVGTARTWDVENRLTSITKAGATTTFAYDGDGSRVKQTAGTETTVYINKYYEKNVTTDNVSTNYYLGSKLVAVKKGSALNYILQDHLGSTSGSVAQSGTVSGTISYLPFGATRSGSGTLPTDKKFTGQQLDSTGLYYYGARYYDPGIGRFISADTIVQRIVDPQTLNRYSYCSNNPLKYVDPTGHGWWSIVTDIASIVFDVYQLAAEPSWGNAGFLALDVVLTCVPIIPAGAGPLAKGVVKGTELLNKGEKVAEDGTKLIEAADKLADGASKTDLARSVGKEGEDAAGIKEPKERIESLSGTAKYRIPDELLHDEKILREIKNVKSQSYTNQLRDFNAWAKENGYEFILEVRPDTQLSRPLQEAIENGDIILKVIGE